jgi:hypothetical protein
MAENDSREMLDERIKQAASETIRQGVDIRNKVHELTLLALRNHRFDRHGIRDVVRSVTEGIALGADKSRTDMRQSMSEALTGLDWALKTWAEAGHLALKQLTTSTKDFSDSELKNALANLKRIEDDFISTVTHVADAANERVRPELREALSTAQRTGTQTGKQVASVMTDFAQKFSVASVDTAIAGLEIANEFGQRFAMIASGILGGLADALRPSPPENKDQPKSG